MWQTKYILIACFGYFSFTCSLQTSCIEEHWCNLNIHSTCWGIKGFTGGYYIKKENVTCNKNSNISVYYSFNIDDCVAPRNIHVSISDLQTGRPIINSQHYNTLANSGVLTLDKSELGKILHLDLIFQKSAEGCDSRTRTQSSCKINTSCPEQTTLGFTTQKTSTIYTIETEDLTTVKGSSGNIGTYIVVLPVVTAGFVFCLGLALFCLVRKRRHQYNEKIDENKTIHSPSKIAEKADFNTSNEQIVQLFLVYADDHKMHLNVVKTMADFLQGDLGFHVTCELFQTMECSQNLASWLENCLEESDKVLVIWSPKMIERWKKFNSTNNMLPYDISSAVLKNIKLDRFYSKNRGKYYFGYFDYFENKTIPKKFRDEPSFLLMNSFEDLYFRLRSIERYHHDGEITENKVKAEHYMKPEYNHHGQALHNAIQQMNEFAKQNPDWNRLSSVTMHNTNPNILEDLRTCVIDIVPPSPLSPRKVNQFKKSPLSFDESAPNPLSFNESAPNPLRFNESAPNESVPNESAPNPFSFNESVPNPLSFNESAPKSPTKSNNDPLFVTSNQTELETKRQSCNNFGETCYSQGSAVHAFSEFGLSSVSNPGSKRFNSKTPLKTESLKYLRKHKSPILQAKAVFATPKKIPTSSISMLENEILLVPDCPENAFKIHNNQPHSFSISQNYTGSSSYSEKTIKSAFSFSCVKSKPEDSDLSLLANLKSGSGFNSNLQNPPVCPQKALSLTDKLSENVTSARTSTTLMSSADKFISSASISTVSETLGFNKVKYQNVNSQKSLLIPQLVLVPIDMNSDPMSSLNALNQYSFQI